jgi:FlaA1/EpsC-like NDP-sugar epimerase
MKQILNINTRLIFSIIHDFVMALLALYLAYLFRFNFLIPSSFVTSGLNIAPAIIGIELSCFFAFGLYKGIWRFAGLPDLIRIFKAVSTSAFLIVAIIFMFKPTGVVPRSVLILNPILLLVLMAGSRFFYRVWKEHKLYGHSLNIGEPVLILGAGDAAVALLKELGRSRDWRVVGLLDDDPSLKGRLVLGAKVLGVLNDLPEIANKLEVSHVIVALPSAKHQVRKHVVSMATNANLNVLTVPAFDDLISGKVSVSQIRKVDVEDLLGRDVVNLDTQGLSQLLTNRVVMVTGAGGSIGSELCRQVLAYHPNKLICLDISEFALYQIQQEFERLRANIPVLYVVADIKNSKRVQQLLSTHQPKVVLHAAAYKHVPMMENQNVSEALINNAFGTYQLASACLQAQVEKFVLISTDKAVNPTNVMGASKRLAELICQSLQPKKPSKKFPQTQFITVRFGNVLGSSGSVIPKFREQIANGGPITITHPDITRYFMSIPEAAQLVLQAGAMGNGGEIFVLDMGESVKIVDLAKDMIKLSGLDEDEIKIEFTGLRPGEKLYEELLADDENTLPTLHEKLRIAQARSVHPTWLDKLLTWLETVPDQTELQIKAQIGEWVEEYQPESDGVKLTAIITQMGSQTIH